MMPSSSSGSQLPTASSRLVEFALSLDGNSLDAALLHHAKRHLIDTVGAILAGSVQQVTCQAAAALETGQPAGEVPVPGRIRGYGLLDAAFLLGVCAHGTEMDDGYREGSAHPGCVVVPAVLALSAARALRGRQLMQALIAGYQAVGAIAAAVHPMLRRRGFHPTAAVGPLGAALAVAVLLGLDRNRALHALAISGSSAAGLFAFNAGGADVKRLHAGHAAREGLLAALLAQSGCEGPPDVLGGVDGFMQAFAGFAPGSLPELQLPPASGFTIAGCYIKPYACCRHVQPAVDALQAIMRRETVAAGDIESIEVETYSIAASHGRVPWTSFAESQLSFPFILATAARFADLRIARFDDSSRSDRTTGDLARKVQVRASDAMDRRYPAQRPACVTLRSTRGTWSHDASEARGAPELPLSDTEVNAKFLDLAGSALGDTQAKLVLQALWAVDQCKDTRPLYAAVATGAGPA